jgi:hypothetical protein
MMGYTLLDADGRRYESTVPGTVGGHRRSRIYGRLDCPSALRAIGRGGYVADRVFFADEATARLAGYRPCSVCMPGEYALWRESMGEAEIAAMLRLLGPAVSVVIGCSRDAPARAAADTLARAWTDRGGEVFDVVDWPEHAASWLRQARRFTVCAPDAWLVTGRVPGWLQMGRRLTRSTGWAPARTIATASLASEELAADGSFDGLRGVTEDGGTWRITGNVLVREGAGR